MFFDFQFRSLRGIAKIPHAAGGTGAASCRAPATELFGRKNLEKSTLAGCQNQSKTGYVGRYLQS